MMSIQILSRYVNLELMYEEYFDHKFVVDIPCYYLEIQSIYQFSNLVLQSENTSLFTFHF